MSKPMTIDLNCDLGESFGPWLMGNDQAIMPFISSANIACGFHAGDFSTMRKTVQLALDNNIAIGAHPALPDLQGFGRRNLAVTPEEVYDMVIYQVGALQGFLKALGGKLNHVKPHGALYQMASKDKALATAIARAIADVGNGDVIFFGLSGSAMIEAGNDIGIPVANEVFADRTYQADGSLTARSEANALITDPKIAIRQVLQMVKEQSVTTTTQAIIPLKTDTICIHGDGVTALEFAQTIRDMLIQENIQIRAMQSQ